jgi:hypothetical protein
MRALLDEVASEFCEGGEDVEDEAAAGCGGVNGFLYGAEANAALGQPSHGIDQVGE